MTKRPPPIENDAADGTDEFSRGNGERRPIEDRLAAELGDVDLEQGAQGRDRGESFLGRVAEEFVGQRGRELELPDGLLPGAVHRGDDDAGQVGRPPHVADRLAEDQRRLLKDRVLLGDPLQRQACLVGVDFVFGQLRVREPEAVAAEDREAIALPRRRGRSRRFSAAAPPVRPPRS